LKIKRKIGQDYGSPSANPDNFFYVSHIGTENFSLMNIGSGEIIWSAKVLSATYRSGVGSLSIGSQGEVYFNAYGFSVNTSGENITTTGLWSFDKNGRQKWFFELEPGTFPNKSIFKNQVFGPPAIDADGNLFFGTVGHDFYAVNATGKTIWSRKFGLRTNFPYGIGCSPVISPFGDIVYFANMYGEVSALKMSTGEDIWMTSIGSYVIATPLLGKSKTLYLGARVGIRGGKFFAVNAENGSIRWECEIGKGIYSSAVIDPKGILYFGCADSCLYAIDSGGDILAETPWPMYARDPQHTARADQIIISGVGAEDYKSDGFSLGNAYPNPFNAKVVIPYFLAEKIDISIDIYNSAGQKVAALASGKSEQGSHSVVWNASGYSSGIYFYVMRSGGGEFLEAKRVILMK